MTGPFKLNANRLSDRIELKPAARGRAARLALSAAVACAITGAAFAQPLLTQLPGNATPVSLSNPQGGTYYIGAANGRWNVNHGAVMFAAIPSVGGGRISADGAYQTCMIANNGAISGNTAGVLPAFSIPGAFAPFTFPLSASHTIAARYSAATSAIVGLPGFFNDAYSQSYQVFGSGDSGTVHAPMGTSQNGRFIAVQGYVSTYNSSAQSVTVTDITPSGGVATVTTTTAHLLAVGNQVTIINSDVPDYNTVVTVTGVPTATTFTFSTASTGTATAGSLSFAPGTLVAASNTFRFRGGIWDANTNTVRLLPTPFRTTSQTTRRRDGTAFAVSDDGLVVVGAQESNLGTTSTSNDPDGGRLVVWRWNGSDYVMSYLPNGVNAGGFPVTYSISAGKVSMNAAGTIIVGPAYDNSGTAFIAKWVWNAGTSSWNLINLGSNINPTLSITTIDGLGEVTVNTSVPHGLAINDTVYIAGDSVAAYNGMWQVMGSEGPNDFAINAIPSGTGAGGTVNKEASWLPSYIRNCRGTTIAMTATGLSNDGNTVVGTMSYNPGACDSTHTPAQAGWIWTATAGYMEDWYDHLNGMGVVGLGLGEPFGPIDSNSPPLLGGPGAISPDASAFTGLLGLTVGARPWVLAPRGCGSADFNCDGDTGTDADIEAFFACLSGNCPASPCTSSADFNGDGDTGTDADIEAFFRVLAGGSC